MVGGTAFSKNISSVGVNVIMADRLDKGREVELKIHILDDDKSVSARGRIAWQVKCPYVPESKRQYYTAGIQFSHMSNEDAISTSDFVRDILDKQSTGKNKKIVNMLEGLYIKE